MKILTGKTSRAHANDAGIDLHCTSSHIIAPNDSAIISTGITISLEPNTFALVKSRSGLSFNYNLEVGAGVIDESYSGELRIHLYNHGQDAYKVSVGDKVAQLITLPVIYPIHKNDKEDTSRDTKGFGSSGV